MENPNNNNEIDLDHNIYIPLRDIKSAMVVMKSELTTNGMTIKDQIVKLDPNNQEMTQQEMAMINTPTCVYISTNLMLPCNITEINGTKVLVVNKEHMLSDNGCISLMRKNQQEEWKKSLLSLFSLF